MATYTVLQDIEAEDTLIGPLTLRQCVYAAVAVLAGWLSYMVISRGAPYLVIVFLPFIAGGVFFAFPWSKQQPTEVWALAKVRFYLLPRKRIWDQSGVKQLVTITAPKRAPKAYTRHLSPTEVQSRLRALADTIDSRGWAVKNIELGYYSQPSILGNTESDRLLDPNSLPQDVPTLDPQAANDIFDAANNPIAHKFDALMSQAAGTHHQQLLQQMSAPPAPEPAAITQYWHMKTIQPPSHTPPASPAGQSAVSQQPASAITYSTDADMSAGQDEQRSASPAASAAPKAAGHAYTPRATTGYTHRQIHAVDDSQASGSSQTQPPIDYTAIRVPGSAAMPSPGAQAQAAGQDSQTTAGPLAAAANPAANPPVTDQPNPAILELANNNDLNVATIAREAQARSLESQGEVVVNLH